MAAFTYTPAPTNGAGVTATGTDGERFAVQLADGRTIVIDANVVLLYPAWCAGNPWAFDEPADDAPDTDVELPGFRLA